MKKITGNRWYLQCFSWDWSDFRNPNYAHVRESKVKKFYSRFANRKLRQLFKEEIENEQRNNLID